MEFRALGDLQVVEDGQALALGPHQQRAVLALLVLSAGEVVSSDRLIEALWGERPTASAAKTVQVYISRLRKTLNGAHAATSSSGELIVTVDHGYVLRVEPEHVDVRVFERLLERGRDAFGDHEFDAAATALRQALGLWRGAPLADFTFDAFAAADIARLQELRLEALEIRIDADLALGRHAALVAELEALTTEHPLRERLRTARMLALYRCGREPEALALYRRRAGCSSTSWGWNPAPRSASCTTRSSDRTPRSRRRPRPGRHRARAADPRVRRRRRAALVAATLALAGGVAAVIALLPKGNAAPVDVAANSVAVIDPRNLRLLKTVVVGTRPGPLAQAAGSVWVANLDDRTITGIDTGSRKAIGTFTPGGPISDMTAAGNSLLISKVGAGVTRWDPTVKAVTRRTPVSVYDHTGDLQTADTPQPLAVDASSLWVGQYGAVTRFDTSRTRQPVLIKGVDNVNAIAVGAGATWVSDTGNDVVSKIEGDSVVGNPIPTGAGPGALAVGNGAVWAAERFANRVARIDPSTDRVVTEIPVGDAPSALAVTGHSLWVANSGDGTLSEIDTRTNHVAPPLHIGNSPAALAAIDGRLWVSVQAPAANVAAPPGGVARVAVRDDPGSLDPALALVSFANLQISNATCANLYSYSDASGAAASQIIPEVARGMPSVSEDGSRYTISIRRGFRFSPPSGEPVTARTFRHVIERTLSPRWHTLTTYPGDPPDIVGLAGYQSGHARHISGLSASGDRLIIRLAHPDPVLAQRLALPVFCAVPDNAPVAERPRLPMAGPYYVSAHSPGKQVVLSRNPNYGGQRPARLNTIDITVGEPPATAIARVIAGTEDYYAAPAGSPNVMSATEADRLRTRYGAGSAARPHFFERPSTLVQYLVFNTARGPFADARLRRAVNYALNRNALAAEPSAGLVERPTDQYLAPGLPGFRDVPIYPPGGDLTRARRLAGRRHRHAVLIVDKNAPFLQRAQIVQSDLAKIGIDVDIQALSVTDKFKREFRGDWDLAPTGWTPDFDDPSDVLNALLRGSHLPPALTVNFAHFDDPAYNRRLDAAARLIGPARYTAYAKLDADLAGNAAPMAAFGVWPNRDLFSARIGCQNYQPLYGIDLAALCVKPQ